MKKIILALSAVLLTACANTTTDPKPVAHYSYMQYPATTLNVASIQVIDGYNQPMQMPNAEHLMPDPLPKAVSDWARAHFKAGGGEGSVTITIKDASVVGKNLQLTPGVKGWFTKDQAERYDGKITVEFAVNGSPLANGGASGSVNVNRGQTIAEDASIQERERTWNTMGEAMLTDLDAGTQQMLTQRLPFLIRK